MKEAGTRALVGLFLLTAGGRGASPSAPLPDGAKPPDGAAAATATVAGDPVLAELWSRAATGEGGELARLADRVGAAGLAERGEEDAASRLTAARAMAFAPEPGAFVGLPFLAELARGADEPVAEAALASAVDLAARPRRATDPEDAEELKAGCDALLGLATDADGSTAMKPAHLAAPALRARRVVAIRALRMLADRGCVSVAAIPTDLDAR